MDTKIGVPELWNSDPRQLPTRGLDDLENSIDLPLLRAKSDVPGKDPEITGDLGEDRCVGMDALGSRRGPHRLVTSHQLENLDRKRRLQVHVRRLEPVGTAPDKPSDVGPGVGTVVPARGVQLVAEPTRKDHALATEATVRTGLPELGESVADDRHPLNLGLMDPNNCLGLECSQNLLNRENPGDVDQAIGLVELHQTEKQSQVLVESTLLLRLDGECLPGTELGTGHCHKGQGAWLGGQILEHTILSQVLVNQTDLAHDQALCADPRLEPEVKATTELGNPGNKPLEHRERAARKAQTLANTIDGELGALPGVGVGELQDGALGLLRFARLRLSVGRANEGGWLQCSATSVGRPDRHQHVVDEGDELGGLEGRGMRGWGETRLPRRHLLLESWELASQSKVTESLELSHQSVDGEQSGRGVELSLHGRSIPFVLLGPLGKQVQDQL